MNIRLIYVSYIIIFDDCRQSQYIRICVCVFLVSAGERRSIVQYREHMIQAKSEEEVSFNFLLYLT